MGTLHQELEGKEARVGEEAHKILDKCRDHKSRIGYKGERKFAFEWFDDLGLQIKAIGEGKQSALQLSPVLASMVRHDKTPDTAKGWAEKLDAEAASAKVAKVAGYIAPALAVANPIGALVGWGAAKLGGVIADSAHDTKTWKNSELSKTSSAESDEKIAAEMRTKLDGVQQAISRTIGRVAGGDVGYLLGLSGLRARVEPTSTGSALRTRRCRTSSRRCCCTTRWSTISSRSLERLSKSARCSFRVASSFQRRSGSEWR